MATDIAESRKLADDAPNCSVIGPFLGPFDGGMRIIIGLPDESEISVLKCSITFDGQPGPSEVLRPPQDSFKVFRFEFTGLPMGKRCDYRFEADGKPVDLKNGLSEKDCWFVVHPPEWKRTDSFILMSCHHPFMVEDGSAEKGWSMWDQLLHELDKDSGIRLLVLGGDQIYNDLVEAEFIQRLEKAENDDVRLCDEKSSLRRRFIRQYQLFWEGLPYRKVLARIPSVAIWDDHDITDGWGSRPESHIGPQIKPAWRSYYGVARDTFEAYQASRNPDTRFASNTLYSFYIDLGKSRIYLLDFRTERRAWLKQLWQKDHESRFATSIKALPEHIRNVFILSPVVPFRTNPGVDERIGNASLLLFKAARWYERHEREWKKYERCIHRGWKVLAALSLGFILTLTAGSIMPLAFSVEWCHIGDIKLFANAASLGLALFVTSLVAFALVGLAHLTHFCGFKIIKAPELPKLTDDIEDGLSAECNWDSLIRLLRVMFDLQANGRQVVLLSGDIHLGGVTEIVEMGPERTLSIPQIVSSPISNAPMPKAAAGMTTTTSEIPISNDGNNEMFARNIFYVSKRNFAQIYSEQIATVGAPSPVLFHLEGHKLPIAVPLNFRP